MAIPHTGSAMHGLLCVRCSACVQSTRTEGHCSQVGLAEALYKLGVCFLQIGYTAQALDHLQQSLALAQELGDSLGQALALAQVKYPYAYPI